MAELCQVAKQGTIGGETYRQNFTDEGTTLERARPSIPAAKTGTLTTRTDANTGVITGQVSHGVNTADKLDVFWEGGSRRNMTVGTVSGTTIPIDLGDGDDLPADESPVTIMVPVEVAMLLDGSNALAVAVQSPVIGYVVFVEDDGGEADIAAATFLIPDNNNTGIVKSIAAGDTNPLDGCDVVKVKFSHGDSTQARVMKAAVVS